MLVGHEVDADFVKSNSQPADAEVTPLLLSQAAFRQQTALYDGKNSLQQAAYQAAHTIKENYGAGVCTVVMIYNACGEPIYLAGNHYWYGHIGEFPVDYRIGNGQYSVFLHIKYGILYTSEGALIYMNSMGTNFIVAWDNPFLGENKVYALIRNDEDYYSTDPWLMLENKLIQSGQDTVTDDTMFTIYSNVGQGTSPIATFTILRKN